MNLKTLLLTQNACYIAGKKMTPKGIMVHSTGANNPYLKRYVGPDDGLLGKNQYSNHWNANKPGGRSICVHGFIGLLGDGATVATYQTLPWNMVGWHSGSGSKGAAANCNNNGYIGFEICEDGLADPVYFARIYQEAAELCAMLCMAYGIVPDKPALICHSEGHALGMASNHADVMHWWPKHGKSMDTFRAEVKRLMGITTPQPTPTPAPMPATDNERTVWDYLKGRGLNDHAAAGLMGNLYAESGLKPTNMQNSYESKLGYNDATYTTAVDSGKYTGFVRDGVGYGLAQWTFRSRKQALLDYAKAAGASIGDLQTQLAFLWRELQGYKAVLSTLKTAATVRQASDAVLLQFERPADQSEAVRVKRAGYGQKYFDKFAEQSGTPAPTPAAPALPYLVRVTAGALNIRNGPGVGYASTGTITDKGVYTITEEANGPGASRWGKLKSGAGWISLDYCRRR